MLWILLSLSGCLRPAEGTFVGNPGTMTASTAGTEGVERTGGGAELVQLEAWACDGSAPLRSEVTSEIDFSVLRAPLDVSLPVGEWCRLALVFDEVTLDFEGAASHSVALGSMTVVLDNGRLVVPEDRPGNAEELGGLTLVLGRPGWLAPLAALTPGESPDEALLAVLESTITTGSTLYAEDGALALTGSGVVGFEPPTCSTPPASLGPVISDCDVQAGYETYSYLSPGTCETGLWVAGVYQARSVSSGDDHPTGEATVHFDVPGSHVLALSAYEPVDWSVTVGPDTTLERILVAGYHAQTVDAPGVPVELVSGPSCGYSWPYNGEGCNTDALLGAFEAAAALPVTRFDGCYDAATFEWAAE